MPNTDSLTSPTASTPPPAKKSLSWLINGEQLDDMHFDPPTFIVDGLLPTGLTVLSAQPKMGKSFMALQLALAVANGDKFINRSTKQGEVLFFGLEDDLRRLQVRSRHLNCNSPLPDALHIHDGTNLDLTTTFERIEEWVEFTENPRLVVIDTLGRVAPDTGNKDPYAAVTGYLGPLQLKARELNIAIVVIHHNRKGESSLDPVEQIHGTTAIAGAADAIFLLSRSRGSNDGRLDIVGRDMEDSIGVELVWEDRIWREKDEPITIQRKLGISTGAADVLEAVHTGYTKSKDIAEALGLSQSNVSNQLRRLTDAGHIKPTSGYNYELMPTAHSALNEQAKTTAPSTEQETPGGTSENPSVLDDDPIGLEDFEIVF